MAGSASLATKAVQPPDAPPRCAMDQVMSSFTEEPAKTRILVVDDDADIADSTVMVLNAYGYDALPAYNAYTAVKIAGAMPPQVALLDLRMPACDGVELAGLLRRLPGLEEILLICLSGHASVEDKQRTSEAGFAYHFTKPVRWQELVAVIEKHKGKSLL
jgi:DNA-binding response OmpR family regulator